MAGYWPFFFCAFVDRDDVEVHKNAKKKKKRGEYKKITLRLREQSGQSQAGNPERPIVPVWVANQNTGLPSSCLPLSHIIIYVDTLPKYGHKTLDVCRSA